MKKLATALLLSAFTLGLSQGVNISKIQRAYIAQDENGIAYVASSKDDGITKMQTKINQIQSKEKKVPYSQFPLLAGTSLPTYQNGLEGFKTDVMKHLDKTYVEGTGMQATTVSFSVDAKGKVTDVKASGTNESLNLATVLAIYNAKPVFKPAQYEGKNISTVVSIDIPVEL